MTAQPTTEPKLKPCRCGRKALIETCHDGDDPQPLFVATCEVCPIETYDQFSVEEAARIWNEFVSAPSVAPVMDEALIRLLLNWRKWYSEDIFSPWTIVEAQAVRAQFPGAVDRIAADSARGTIDRIIEDIREGKHVAPASPAAPTGAMLKDAGAILCVNDPDVGARVEIRFAELKDAQRLHQALTQIRASAPAALRDEASVDAERQAAAIVTIWRAIKDHDDRLLVRYIKQALLEWKPVAATTPPSTLARKTAEEIREWIGLSGFVDGEGLNEVAAIIERCFSGDGGE